MKTRATAAILVAAAIVSGCAQVDGTATRMACLPAGNYIEPRFLAALDATASIRIAGESLELRDRDGKVRMRLEAQYFR